MPVDHQRRVGDELRPIRITLLDSNGNPVQLRAPDNVPPITSLKIRRSGLQPWQAPVHSAVVEEVQADPTTNGRIAYYPQGGDFDIPSIYETLFHIVWQGGEDEHFPHAGYFLVEVQDT